MLDSKGQGLAERIMRHFARLLPRKDGPRLAALGILCITFIYRLVLRANNIDFSSSIDVIVVFGPLVVAIVVLVACFRNH